MQVYHECLEEDDKPYDSVHSVEARAIKSRTNDLILNGKSISNCDGIRKRLACDRHEYTPA